MREDGRWSWKWFSNTRTGRGRMKRGAVLSIYILWLFSILTGIVSLSHLTFRPPSPFVLSKRKRFPSTFFHPSLLSRPIKFSHSLCLPPKNRSRVPLKDFYRWRNWFLNAKMSFEYKLPKIHTFYIISKSNKLLSNSHNATLSRSLCQNQMIRGGSFIYPLSRINSDSTSRVTPFIYLPPPSPLFICYYAGANYTKIATPVFATVSLASWKGSAFFAVYSAATFLQADDEDDCDVFHISLSIQWPNEEVIRFKSRRRKFNWYHLLFMGITGNQYPSIHSYTSVILQGDQSSLSAAAWNCKVVSFSNLSIVAQNSTVKVGDFSIWQIFFAHQTKPFTHRKFWNSGCQPLN